MICPLCHTQNRDDAKFCKGCGQPLRVEPAHDSKGVPLRSPSDTPSGQPLRVEPAHDSKGVPLRSPSDTPSGQPLRAESVHSADEVVMVNAVPTAPGSSASATQAQENAAAPAQGTAQASNQPQPEPAQAPEGPAPAIDDVANAPTLILTPEKMMAFHSQRWQQEIEQAQNEQAGTASGMEHKDTSLPDTQGDSAVPSEQNEQPQQDVADMPTVLMRQSDHENSSSASNTVEADEPIPAPPPPPPSSLPTAQTDSSQTETPVGAGADVDAGRGPSWSPADTSAVDAGRGPSWSPADTSAPDITNETNDAGGSPADAEESEEPMQASSDTSNHPTDDQQAASNGDFPILSTGLTLAGRYEITQVVSDDPQEHVYQVIDHQGYQHCWNCGSEQNGEGDEFCIDCGAGLLNVPYLMHEYPTSLASNAGKSGTVAPDAHVLQGNIANTFIEQGHTYAIEQPQAEQNPFPNGVRLLAACDSDAGDVRRSEPNEDSALVLQLQRVFESAGTPEGVFIVADGLGGHDNGQVASRMTINIIAERMVRELLSAPLSAEKNGESVKPLDEDALISLFHDAIQDANTALVQKNQQDKTDMGSTITGFMIVGDHAYIINVGDSRTYMLRGQQLYQLTTDHSLVGQLVASGLIEPDDVYTHPQRSQIFRSLGDKMNVQIDMFKQQLHPGDILLSCSDGLWEMVRNPQIESMLNDAPDPQTACAQLIEAANTNGGEDNISAVIVFVR